MATDNQSFWNEQADLITEAWTEAIKTPAIRALYLRTLEEGARAIGHQTEWLEPADEVLAASVRDRDADQALDELCEAMRQVKALDHVWGPYLFEWLRFLVTSVVIKSTTGARIPEHVRDVIAPRYVYRFLPDNPIVSLFDGNTRGLDDATDYHIRQYRAARRANDGGVGRKLGTGTYSTKAQFVDELHKQIRNLRREHRKITAVALADLMAIDRTVFYDYQKRYGVSWQQERDRVSHG